MSGTEIVHVPYKGGTAAITDSLRDANPEALADAHQTNSGVLPGYTVWSASFAPGIHFETNSDLCATAYCAAGLRSTSRAIASTMSAGTPRRPVARGNFIVFVCPPRGGQVCCL